MDFVRVSVMLWLQVHEGRRRYYVIVPSHLVILFSALVPNVMSHGLRYLVRLEYREGTVKSNWPNLALACFQ